MARLTTEELKTLRTRRKWMIAEARWILNDVLPDLLDELIEKRAHDALTEASMEALRSYQRENAKDGGVR